MGDKIDFNAALEDCKRVRDSIKSDDDFQNADYGLVMYYLNTIVQALEIATTVKRGRWIDIGHNAGLKCSNCGKRIKESDTGMVSKSKSQLQTADLTIHTKRHRTVTITSARSVARRWTVMPNENMRMVRNGDNGH